MKLYIPFWIPLVAIVAAHATGAINVFTMGAQILTGVDGTVNAVLDFKKWVPQVNTYVKGHVHAASTAHRVRLAKMGTDTGHSREGSLKRQDFAHHRGRTHGQRAVAEEIFPRPE